MDSGFLRANPLERLNVIEKMLSLGLITVEQARGNTNATVISGLYSTTTKLADLGPYPNRGVAANQSYVMVGNMILLVRLLFIVSSN